MSEVIILKQNKNKENNNVLSYGSIQYINTALVTLKKGKGHFNSEKVNLQHIFAILIFQSNTFLDSFHL